MKKIPTADRLARQTRGSSSWTPPASTPGPSTSGPTMPGSSMPGSPTTTPPPSSSTPPDPAGLDCGIRVDLDPLLDLCLLRRP